jgi:hypothetical protein
MTNEKKRHGEMHGICSMMSEGKYFENMVNKMQSFLGNPVNYENKQQENQDIEQYAKKIFLDDHRAADGSYVTPRLKRNSTAIGR